VDGTELDVCDCIDGRVGGFWPKRSVASAAILGVLLFVMRAVSRRKLWSPAVPLDSTATVAVAYDGVPEGEDSEGAKGEGWRDAGLDGLLCRD